MSTILEHAIATLEALVAGLAEELSRSTGCQPGGGTIQR
jgi:hypothetical protein